MAQFLPVFPNLLDQSVSQILNGNNETDFQSLAPFPNKEDETEHYNCIKCGLPTIDHKFGMCMYVNYLNFSRVARN
jgi:hypothetical protein